MQKRNQVLIKKLQKKAGKAINSYNLIDRDDKVLVALSGGIDSMVLLDVLCERLKTLPVKYDLNALHVVVEDLPVQTNTQLLENLCNKKQIPLHIAKVRYQKETDDNKFECFPCSWNRRKAIFQKTQSLGCNKVAFGHHMDDTLETLLMNMVHHAEISAIPPKLTMRKSNFEIIRPLILCTSKEVEEYANMKELKSAEPECPYGDESNREIFKEIIEKISHIHDQAKINLFNSMDNIFREYLPEKPGK